MGVFMGLKTAQYLLSMYNRINVVAISLPGLSNIDEVKYDLSGKLKNDLTVLSWDEVIPDLKQSIQIDNVSGILFLGILIIIVAFGILNTVLMSVTERFKKFGVSLSIGMPQEKLVAVVFFETIFITIVGLLIGNLIGWGINYYFVLHPITFGGEFGSIYEEYGFLPQLESSLNISIFINSTLSILAISFIAVLYPLYKVYKLEPLKGIRYT